MITSELRPSLTIPIIAPCEHIAGNEKFIRKAFEIQKVHRTPSGRSLVDVTLDLEDGAATGEESKLRANVIGLLNSASNEFKQAGVRIHASDSPHFLPDIIEIVQGAGQLVGYITLPKVLCVAEVAATAQLISKELSLLGIDRTIPLHVLIETPQAVREVDEIAALPEVQVLDFGLMDFISELGGGIPATCMRSPGQFEHKLVSRVKEAICMAALGRGKIAGHNVTVDFRNPEQAFADATRARLEYGFLRMWSIHPDQIGPIIRGMLPSQSELHEAADILSKAKAANWGPIEHNGRLHDRASFRYYQNVVNRGA